MAKAEAQTQNINDLPEIVEPFIELDYFKDAEFTQTNLDNLKNFYNAKDHPDFKRENYTDLEGISLCGHIGRIMHLPLRLSLGIHAAAINEKLNSEASITTYATFASGRPLIRSSEISGEQAGLDRAQSVLAEAIIEAAADLGNIKEIQEAIKFSRRNQMLSFSTGRIVKKAVQIVEI